MPNTQFAAEARAILAATCAELAALGITHVHIAYDGYGDSGSVEHVYAVAGEQEIALAESLAEVLADAAEKLLPLGYENNDGAFGELVLDVAAQTVTREHNWRVSETEFEEHQFDLHSSPAPEQARAVDTAVAVQQDHVRDTLTVKLAVAGSNAEGEPDLAFVKVRCTQAQHDEGEHYQAAKSWAASHDYEAPFVAFDEFDSAGKHLMQFFEWATAMVVDIAQHAPPSPIASAT